MSALSNLYEIWILYHSKESLVLKAVLGEVGESQNYIPQPGISSAHLTKLLSAMYFIEAS